MKLDTDMSIADEFESDFRQFFRSIQTKYNLDSDEAHKAISDAINRYEIAKMMRKWREVSSRERRDVLK